MHKLDFETGKTYIDKARDERWVVKEIDYDNDSIYFKCPDDEYFIDRRGYAFFTYSFQLSRLNNGELILANE